MKNKILAAMVVAALALVARAANVTVICDPPNPTEDVLRYDYFLGAGTNTPTLFGSTTNFVPKSVTNIVTGEILTGVPFTYSNLTAGVYRLQVAAVNFWGLASVPTETTTPPAKPSAPVIKTVWINVP